jgi:hypothetical protein
MELVPSKPYQKYGLQVPPTLLCPLPARTGCLKEAERETAHSEEGLGSCRKSWLRAEWGGMCLEAGPVARPRDELLWARGSSWPASGAGS